MYNVTETSTPARDKWRPIGAKAPRLNIRYTVIQIACTVQQVWPNINTKQWAEQTNITQKQKEGKKKCNCLNLAQVEIWRNYKT